MRNKNGVLKDHTDGPDADVATLEVLGQVSMLCMTIGRALSLSNGVMIRLSQSFWK